MKKYITCAPYVPICLNQNSKLSLRKKKMEFKLLNNYYDYYKSLIKGRK